jgi:ribosomal protein S12 methylthiotransferase accessory factor
MLGKYRNSGVELYVTDFSLDTGIPTVGALAYDPSTFPEKSEIVWTAGTTPSPQKSLSRALTEVAQLGGDFNTGSNYVASGLPKFKNMVEADYITGPGREVDLRDLPDLSDDNLRIEVENCVSALSSIGMDVIAIEITHDLLKVPAFYTIIPGAHFRERATGTSVGMFTAKLIAELGNPMWAMKELALMNEHLPDKYYIRFFEGLCLFTQAEPKIALMKFEDALRLEPKEEDIPTLYSYMGQCLKEMGEYSKAIEVLNKGVNIDADRTDIHNLMGFCHFKLGEHERAIECFRNVLELDPSSAIDYANIASNYRDMGDRENAIHYYRLALELDPSIDFARDNLEHLESL